MTTLIDIDNVAQLFNVTGLGSNLAWGVDWTCDLFTDSNSSLVNSVPPTLEAGRWKLVGDTWEDKIDYLTPITELSTAKAAKRLEINEARLLSNFSTFEHDGFTFACDPLSRSDIDGVGGYVAMYGALSPDWVGGWKTVDNSYYPIVNVEQWKNFYTSMVRRGTDNFIYSQRLKSILDNCQTIDEVDRIYWGMSLPDT